MQVFRVVITRPDGSVHEERFCRKLAPLITLVRRRLETARRIQVWDAGRCVFDQCQGEPPAIDGRSPPRRVDGGVGPWAARRRS